MARIGVTPDDLKRYRDDWHMSPGVISNGLMFLTGMTGNRSDGSIASSPEEQIRDAFARVADVLNEAGLDTTHIVEMTSYHVAIHDHIDMFRILLAACSSSGNPAEPAIEVSGFITHGAIVELRVVADASSLS